MPLGDLNPPKPGKTAAHNVCSRRAGKTTLMDCLAQRKDEGDLKGEILINGKPLPVSFVRVVTLIQSNLSHTSLSNVPLHFASKTTFINRRRQSVNPWSFRLYCDSQEIFQVCFRES